MNALGKSIAIGAVMVTVILLWLMTKSAECEDPATLKWNGELDEPIWW